VPRYIYRCKECEEEIQRTHSIKEKLKDILDKDAKFDREMYGTKND